MDLMSSNQLVYRASSRQARVSENVSQLTIKIKKNNNKVQGQPRLHCETLSGIGKKKKKLVCVCNYNLLEVLGHELVPKWEMQMDTDLILSITPTFPVSQTSPFNLSLLHK